MTKLLLAYLANPSLRNAQRLRAYDRSHPMAACLLSKGDSNVLANAIYHANNPPEA